jgi:hypothetical protein
VERNNTVNCAVINCPPNPSFPLLGFSSEAQDVPTFTAMGFGPGVPPPLNYDFGLTEGFAIATSTVSAQAASIAAQQQATANAVSTWVAPGELPPWPQPGDQEQAYEDNHEFESVPPIY